MRPTRRGIAFATVAVGALFFAFVSGPRSLNAVAGPLLVALAVGAIQVVRAGTPTVERSQPRHGFPGETRTVTLTIEGSGVARITEHADDGLSVMSPVERTLPATISYDLTYERRGVHEIRRTTVVVGDALGLFERRHQIHERTEVVVFPSVQSLGEETFVRTLGYDLGERTEFDRLREYVPGDSLRDVHWKSSASHDELLVTEFTDPVDDEGISIAARGDPGRGDEMATAAATLLVGALRSGLSVALTVPAGSLADGVGQAHQQRALELLARTAGGDVSRHAWETADVQIRADDDCVTVTIDDTAHELSSLTVARANPLIAEGLA